MYGEPIRFYDDEAVPSPLGIRFGTTLVVATLGDDLLTPDATLALPAVYQERRPRGPTSGGMQDGPEEFAVPAADDDQPRQ